MLIHSPSLQQNKTQFCPLQELSLPFPAKCQSGCHHIQNGEERLPSEITLCKQNKLFLFECTHLLSEYKSQYSCHYFQHKYYHHHQEILQKKKGNTISFLFQPDIFKGCLFLC